MGQRFLKSVEFFFEYTLHGKGAGNYWEEVSDEERIYRILFRQNLRDDALKWFRQLAPEIKQNWKVLKETFIEAYNAETDAAPIKYTLEIASLVQSSGESISAYVQRAEALYKQAPALDDIIGVDFLKGMHDTNQKSLVNFECARARNHSFTSMRPVIKTTFHNGTLSIFSRNSGSGLSSERAFVFGERLPDSLPSGSIFNSGASKLVGNSQKSGSLFNNVQSPLNPKSGSMI
ncbi:MAG: hypothetical protein MMC33_006030 [Icmadophila ericetorum]|nr:hypothetical protein [Icmadophila ericetorum]